MDLSSFPSAVAKIARAQTHLDTLKHILITAREREPYRLVTEQNLQATRYSVVLKIREELPFENIALIAGDCIHNLRSALDHVVYQIAAKETQSSPPPKHKSLTFPIGKNYAEFVKQLWRVECLSQPVRQALEQAQSYHRPHEYLPPVLAVLSEHDNIDKHRLLRVVLTTISAAYFSDLFIRGVPTGLQACSLIEVRQHGLSLKNNTELGAITFPRPTPHAQVKFVADVHVSVPHSAGPKGHRFTSVDYVLEQMIAEVTTSLGIVCAAAG